MRWRVWSEFHRSRRRTPPRGTSCVCDVMGRSTPSMKSGKMPATATPHITSALRIAGLRGRNFELVEHRVLKKLSQAGVKPGRSADAMRRGYVLTEDLALMLGLLFRTLAPMRSRDNMRAVADGIEAMGHEEAAYWLGMAMHRKHPRRVLTALRFLLTEPKR